MPAESDQALIQSLRKQVHDNLAPRFIAIFEALLADYLKLVSAANANSQPPAPDEASQTPSDR